MRLPYNAPVSWQLLLCYPYCLTVSHSTSNVTNHHDGRNRIKYLWCPISQSVQCCVVILFRYAVHDFPDQQRREVFNTRWIYIQNGQYSSVPLEHNHDKVSRGQGKRTFCCGDYNYCYHQSSCWYIWCKIMSLPLLTLVINITSVWKSR